jgi:formylglycine-generating enzyme required for sulfatase activity
MTQAYSPANQQGPQEFPPACADAWGDDEFGLFIDLRVNDEVQRFRWIEPGDFQMGRPETEKGVDGETPQHWVRITQGYWMADSACTQAFWLAVMGGKNPSFFTENTEHPVEQVDKKTAQAFMKKLSNMLAGASLEAVLPSEAQWEYACRAGTTEAFSFGETITPEQVNYDGNYPYGDGAKGLYRKQTVPVKSLPANPWGLYEMHGNAWEWCSDAKRTYKKNAPLLPEIDPEGRGEGWVLRGGSWIDVATWGNATSATTSLAFVLS